MAKITLENMIDNLRKWEQICSVMGNKKDIEVIQQIMIKIQEDKSSAMVSSIKPSEKKLSDRDKIKEILDCYNKNLLKDVTNTKLVFLKEEIDIISEWNKLTEKQKKKCTKNELLAIYNILYKPSDIKCKAKNKDDLINDINYFINEKNRNYALKNSNLIG